MSSKEMTFEQAVETLEEIIRKMESGNVSLEESIECFKKGTELIKYCDKTLEKYEKLITTVTVDGKGNVTEVGV